MTTQDIRISTTMPTLASTAAPKATETAAAPRETVTLGNTAAPALMPKPKVDAAAPGKPEYVPGQVLVKFAPGFAAADVNTLADDFGLTTLRHFNVPEQMVEKFGGELYQFKLQKGETVDEAIKRLSGQPGVVYAEPNYKIQLNDPPSEPTPPPTEPTEPEPPSEVLPDDLDSRLWGIRNQGQDGGTAGVDVGAVEAWKTTTGQPNGQGPLILVIDTGIDYNHPDLAANVWVNPNEVPGDGVDDDDSGIADDIHGANLIFKDGNPMDDNDHGTHCAGTIGAVGNNGDGIVGVNWNATIAGAKFLDGGGSGTYADAVESVLYATRIGARITSNSWGGGGFSQALYDAFAASPALHIAAAGNESSNTDTRPSYPGGFDLDNIVSVAALDRNGNLADFSNYGAVSVDVAAPGVDVYSLKPGGEFQEMSGTSMATPHVAGVAGLILSAKPELTNEQLKSRLVNTAVKQENLAGIMVSGGRVNAANALEDDSIAPDAPGDFNVAQAGATGMTLSWTATGDDGLVGRASSYEIRYSDKPITLEHTDESVTWDEATPASGMPTPNEPGSIETARVAISPEDAPKHYYFAMKVLDNLGNASDMAVTEGDSIAAAVAFKDDMEAENDNWTADGTWARVDVEGHGKVYTDSPDGSYGDDADTALTSKTFDLSGVGSPRLSFNLKMDTENNYDYLHVEVTEDGQTWNELAQYDGNNAWAEKAIDLSAYEGKQVQVRFRLTSDSSVSKDGVYIDNVKVAGDPPAPPTEPTEPPSEG